ncbi:hypothetical protein D9615_006711 [Tricholomella constricta]|uniref:Uncharacterized protein n=1 Tax=Tricholomella constricta TaxID=117010 RepID=A0A8H5H7B0_9AGAR|nr:hypothetical protein D9615_006711 [Tricholomella constricta]
MKYTTTLLLMSFFSLLRSVHGHVAAWHKGMYCLNGTSGTDDPSTNAAVNPLFQLPFSDWWMHHVNKCDEFPPAPGDFLELPANGAFTVELAVNRAFTTFSFKGIRTGRFADGEDHPGLGETPPGEVPPCITEPNIHAQNQSMAAGSAFAISYQSDITKVTPENLVVFTVLYNSPWERLAMYSVPNLPACPPEGCICAWGWVPNGCGEPNMYMLPYRCKVTGWTGNAAVAPGSPPTWCEDDQSKCTKGPKQMVYWNQLEGNNIEVSGEDLSGEPRSPAYNAKLGFSNGAQTDIFSKAGSATQTSVAPGPTSITKPSSASARIVVDVACVALVISSVLVGLL